MIINLVLVLVMFKLVWVLVPPTLTPKMFIVLFIVVILCHTRLGNIHPFVVHKNTGIILHTILGGRIIMFLMVLTEMVLILGTPTSPPKNMVLSDTGMMWGLICINNRA